MQIRYCVEVGIRFHCVKGMESIQFNLLSFNFRINILRLQDNKIMLRMVNSCIEYGYEYVGNFSPMVITPTVERCYRSFFIAFKYNLGIYIEY